MSSAKIEDKFSALELARAAALEDAPRSEQVGELVSISYDEAEDSDQARIATYLFEANLILFRSAKEFKLNLYWVINTKVKS